MAMAVRAEDTAWLTSLPEALTKAKAEKKLVLVDFTGSDWCIWCKKLKKEVFSEPAFADYAKTNLVLVEVDFPRTKEQTKALKQTNQQLMEKYKVKGFPTVFVLDAEQKTLGTLGYMEGGSKAFIQAIEKVRK